MKKVLIASFVSAFILMFWGNFYWMMSGIPEKKLHNIENENAIIDVLKNNISESGRYIIPWFNSEKFAQASSEEQEKIWAELVEKHKVGPLVTVVYQKDGVNPMEFSVFAMGFVHFWISSILICIILSMNMAESSYKKRYFTVVLIGIFASFYIDVADPIWFHHPWKYHLWNSFFHIGGWLFSAFAIAGILKPKP